MGREGSIDNTRSLIKSCLKGLLALNGGGVDALHNLLKIIHVWHVMNYSFMQCYFVKYLNQLVCVYRAAFGRGTSSMDEDVR